MGSTDLSDGSCSSVDQDVHPINVKKCIELHNKLVEYTLDKLGYDKASQNVKLNWFTVHGEQAEKARDGLSAPIVEFLENTYAWDLYEQGTLFLNPEVRGLSEPFNMLRPEHENPMFHEAFPNGIELYHTHELDWDGQGLIFNMTRNLVRWYPLKTDMKEKYHVWVPLERALELWWANVEDGRNYIHRFPPNVFGDDAPEWKRSPYTDVDLERTIVIWDAYVDLIHSRAPAKNQSDTSLLSREDLDENNVTGFARQLLSRMRRPGVTYIAPGLRVFDEALAALVFPEYKTRASHRSPDDKRCGSFLLFHSDVRVGNQSISDRYRYYGPIWKTKRLLDDRCGIYIGTNDMGADDFINFVAPKAVRKDDQSTDDGRTEIHFDEPYDVYSASLLDTKREFEMGAVTGRGYMQLYQLIAVWYDKVDSGDWKVTGDGVEGSLEDNWAALPLYPPVPVSSNWE